MRYHVPFAHRNPSGRPASLRPIYIGFDEPVSIQNRKHRRRARKGPFNWSGFFGLLLALLSPLTLFVLAPIALLFSLNGMRRAPRGMAFVGLIFSGLATTVLSLGIFAAMSHRHEAAQQYAAHVVSVQNREQIKETRETLAAAQDELRDYRTANENSLPSLTHGMDLAIGYEDAWGKSLMYIALEESCMLLSAGPDGQFDSSDDISVRVDGMPDDWTFSSESTSLVEQ